MTRILAVVPARMSSSRFPGKPLKTINGIPMIAHCYFRALQAKHITKVVLATPDSDDEHPSSPSAKLDRLCA